MPIQSLRRGRRRSRIGTEQSLFPAKRSIDPCPCSRRPPRHPPQRALRPGRPRLAPPSSTSMIAALPCPSTRRHLVEPREKCARGNDISHPFGTASHCCSRQIPSVNHEPDRGGG